MSESMGEVDARDWGEFGKKVMEFRRRLSDREQSMLDDVLHAAWKGMYGEGEVAGYGLTTGAHVNRERWPTEPPETWRAPAR